MSELATTAPTKESATGLPEGVSLTKLSSDQVQKIENRLYSESELPGVTFKRIEAPNNIVFDEDNGRVLSLPQGLSETETEFVIQRDVDEIKTFFAMQDTGGFEALGKGIAAFIAIQPQFVAGLVKEQAELAQINHMQRPVALMGLGEAALAPIGMSLSFLRNAAINLLGADDMVNKSNELIERNKKYMADAGLTPPAEGGLSGFLYDLGNGGASLLASLGIAALTRDPKMSAAYFGAMQKSMVYQEARDAGKSPDAASDISLVAGVVGGGIEYIGLDHFMKALKGNSAVKRFISGFAIESLQEGAQAAADELITQTTGVREKPIEETVAGILYQAALGGMLGGMSNAAIGAFVQKSAEDQGIDKATAEKMGKYAEENVDAAKENMGEFIDKELAPIAADDESAQHFITLMQKFGNDQTLVERESLNPKDREVFDQYVQMFNNSRRDLMGIADVEQRFFDMAKAAGRSDDEAAAAAKLIGARADAASRALGITPQQWLESKGLSLVGPEGQDPKYDKNGNIILDEKDVLFQKSDAFKEWFGDSKVIDDDGKPLVVYHGTAADASGDFSFDPSRIGQNFGYDKIGFFFTDNKRSARSYSRTKEEAEDISFRMGERGRAIADARTIAVYVSIKKPITGKILSETDGYKKGAIYNDPIDIYDDNRALIERLLSSDEFDGVILKAGGERLIVAKRPEQIKSVQNRGTWDADDPRILFQMEYVHRNKLGLFSKLEQEVMSMNIPSWKKIKEKISDPLGMTESQIKKQSELEGRASGTEIWQKLSSLPVKKEEIEWTGIEEFLKAGDKFTRSEVLEFIRGNGVNVEEVIADKDASGIEEIEWNEEIIDNEDYIQSRAENIKSEMENYNQDTIDEIIDRIAEDEAEYIKKNFDGDKEDQDAVRQYIMEEFSGEVDARMEEHAYDQAKYEYYDNPYMRYTNDQNAYEIVGNDDVGYSMTDNNGRNFGSRFYSLNEAQIQALDRMREYGDIESNDDVNVAKWEDYVSSGRHTNYREVKLTLPEIEGDFYNDTHFPDRNLVAFLRVTDRKSEDENEIKKFIDALPEKVPDDYEIGGYGAVSDLERSMDIQEEIRDEKKSQLQAELDKLEPKDKKKFDERVADLWDEDQAEQMHEFVKFLFPAGSEQTNLSAAYMRYTVHIRETKHAISDAKKSWKENTSIKYKYAASRSIGNMKIYFVDEFQSDWHQDGRQMGYEGVLEDIDTTGWTAREMARGQWSTFSSDGSLIRENTFADSEQEAIKITARLRAESANRNAVPNAPFKGDNWIALGLKRALVQAAEGGYDAFAWADAETLMDRWSSRYEKLYRTQYDTKMPSIVKKITGIQPEHVERGEFGEGHWQLKITPDMREKILKESFPLFQGKKGSPRGSITFTNEDAIIRLFKTANPSTLLHELGHLFLRDMRDVAKTTQRPRVRADYEAVKKWLGAKNDDFTVAQEEKFARGFEAYLMEGKAPNNELQSVFDRFKEWLTSIYKSVESLNVKLTPEVREVFDRMLGADYARSEVLAQEQGERDMEADYAIVAGTPPPGTFLPDTADVLRNANELSADLFVPVSTRLGKINSRLKHAVRRFTFNVGLYTERDREIVKPLIKGVSEKFSPADYRVLDLALKNRDAVKADFLMDKYRLQKEWKSVREILDKIYIDAADVGLGLNYLEEYFPRKVKRGMAAEYVSAMMGKEEWSEIEFAMREADPNGIFTIDEQAEFINNYLRGFVSSRINLSRPSFTKERTIDYVEPEFNKYYQDSMPTLIEYIGGMRHAIEARKLFGKSEKEADENIGLYVRSLIKEGVISNRQEEDLKKILKAVVEPTGTRGVVTWAKNAAYIYTMGNPISAITQIQDLAFSMHKNGYWRTSKSFLKSVSRNPVLKKEDIGIENVLQEFEDETRSGKAVRAVFKIVGLEWMDNIGKETFMGAAYDRLRAANKKGDSAFVRMLTSIFGDQTAQVRDDLKKGVMSENVKYMIFSELSDYQPISLAEMPVTYLRSGNGRVFYMLKTYTIKQIDTYRREIFDLLASGDKAQAALGLKNLISLAIALMLMGMSTDALKDLLLGREIEIDDLVMDNILKVMTFTKYQVYKARTEGIGNALLRTLFMPPIFAPVDDLTRDITQIASGKKSPEDARILGQVPLFGKFYFWWLGGGQEKDSDKKSSISSP